MNEKNEEVEEPEQRNANSMISFMKFINSFSQRSSVRKRQPITNNNIMDDVWIERCHNTD